MARLVYKKALFAKQHCRGACFNFVQLAMAIFRMEPGKKDHCHLCMQCFRSGSETLIYGLASPFLVMACRLVACLCFGRFFVVVIFL